MPICDYTIEQPKRKCKRSMPITYPGRKRDRLFPRDFEVGCDLTAEEQGLHFRGFFLFLFLSHDLEDLDAATKHPATSDYSLLLFFLLSISHVFSIHLSIY